MKKFLLLLALCLTFTGIMAQDTVQTAETAVITQTDSTTTLSQETQPAGIAPNPYKDIIAKKEFAFNIYSILRGILGMAVIIFIAWLFSLDRKRVNWKTVGIAHLFQLILAISVIAFPFVQDIFEFVGKMFVAVLNWTKAGSEFLFGPLVDTSNFGFIFALQILPTIIFFSALTSLLFYPGVLQKVGWEMAWVLS